MTCSNHPCIADAFFDACDFHEVFVISLLLGILESQGIQATNADAVNVNAMQTYLCAILIVFRIACLSQLLRCFHRPKKIIVR